MSNADDLWMHFFTDVTAGSMCGVAICLSAHPFDTIKVRMQMSPKEGLLQIVRQTWQREGLRAFYQGMASPLYTNPLVNASVFSAYEFFKRVVRVGESGELNFQQGVLAGMFAGLVNSLIVGPVELLKCRMQIQDYRHQAFHTPAAMLRHVLATEGARGLFRGMFSTIFREVFAYAAQFATYEETKQTILNYTRQKSLTPVQALCTGAAAGLACWFFSYPQDTVKTKLQCEVDPRESRRKYPPLRWFPDGGFFACGSQIVREQGLLALFKGFSACTGRAVIGNAFGFLAYEKSSHYLKIKFDLHRLEH